MKYFEINFHLEPCDDVAQDVIMALAAEAGCESFVNTDTGVQAFVQEDLWNKDVMDEGLRNAFLPNVQQATYTVDNAPDEDWNETWEKESFRDAYVGDECVIHSADFTAYQPRKYDITIQPKLAFGTGTHPTTCQLLQLLIETNMTGWRVLDAGCGTGILSIMAARRGATEVVGYDVDEWCVDNTRLNCQLNQVDNVEVELGNSSVVSHMGLFDLVIANINLNILLADMETFVKAMKPGALLYMSGFYHDDVPTLQAQAEKFGLTLQTTRVKDDWAIAIFRKA